MNDGMIRIRAHKEPWWDAISLLICECSYDGKIAAVAEPLVMNEEARRWFVYCRADNTCECKLGAGAHG